ncbi:MAG: CBS domain-containing protein [Nitrospirota bacterium]
MEILVESLMTEKAFSIGAGRTVCDLASEMTHRKVGSLLVKKQEEYVGIVTEVDIVRRVVSNATDPKSITVESIMTSPIITIAGDRSVMEANNLMEEKHIRHIAVTREGEIVGMLSIRDLLHPVYVE